MVNVLALFGSVGSFSGVAHVVDGDTLHVGEVRVRLSGVDAPEMSQRCGPAGRQVACGVMAANWLRTRLEGRTVTCSTVDQDRYRRTVAVCRLGNDDIGRSLVEAGWATAYRRYSLAYVGQEDAARKARHGIWALGFEEPAAYRQERRLANAQPVPNPRCAIKGNINAKGEHIYHMPGSRAYAEVRIDLNKNERWFCSEAEAGAAGWRPVR